MKLNHIGIATNNIEKLINEYTSQGYKVVNIIYDDIQLANLCLLRKNNSVDVELVTTLDTNSKVYNLSKNNYSKEYHKCYETNNIRDEIKKLKTKKYILISDINYSVLLKGEVCFMYKSGKLIELLEREK